MGQDNAEESRPLEPGVVPRSGTLGTACTARGPRLFGARTGRERVPWAAGTGTAASAPIGPGEEAQMYDTVVTVVGNVGSDVRQASTSGGAVLASFRLACTTRHQDRDSGAWVDGSTTWYRVTAWRALADNVASSISKGDPVIVHGRLRTSVWEKDGRSGESLEIDAVTVGPDLTRGRAVFRRVVRVPAPPGASARGDGDGVESAGRDPVTASEPEIADAELTEVG